MSERYHRRDMGQEGVPKRDTAKEQRSAGEIAQIHALFDQIAQERIAQETHEAFVEPSIDNLPTTELSQESSL